jgi:hypothetical protein
MGLGMSAGARPSLRKVRSLVADSSSQGMCCWKLPWREHFLEAVCAFMQQRRVPDDALVGAMNVDEAQGHQPISD